MRCWKRVVQTAAPLRDRPAGVMKSATRAISLRDLHFAYATSVRLVARTPQNQSEIRTGLGRARPSLRPVYSTSPLFEFFAAHRPPACRMGRCTTGDSHEQTWM